MLTAVGAGLTKGFYRERWKRFTDGVLAAMKTHRSFDAKKFHKDIRFTRYEWTLQHETFPVSSGEDTVKVANEKDCGISIKMIFVNRIRIG